MLGRTLNSNLRRRLMRDTGDDGGNGGGGNDGGGGGSGTGTGDDDGDGGDDDSDDDDDSSKDDQPVSREEFNRLFKRMQAADRRASAAEAKVQEFEGANKSELEKAKEEAAKARAEADEKAEALKTSRIENAFFQHSKVTWHDPEDALRAIDLSDVEIDDDGKVSGMAEAVKALIKKKPYLVKDQNVQPAPEATGSANNGRRKGDEPDAEKEKRKARFPAAYRSAG